MTKRLLPRSQVFVKKPVATWKVQNSRARSERGPSRSKTDSGLSFARPVKRALSASCTELQAVFSLWTNTGPNPFFFVIFIPFCEENRRKRRKRRDGFKEFDLRLRIRPDLAFSEF